MKAGDSGNVPPRPVATPVLHIRAKWCEWLMVCMYLTAIVASNLIVTKWGQPALVVTAWVLIPFDMVTRDVLHNRWHGKRLWPKMLVLVAAGSALSYAANADSARVALASVCAFSAGNVVNTAVYGVLWSKPTIVKMACSNAVVALVDSIIFPLIAFASLDWTIVGMQYISKTGGALAWAWILVRIFKLK